MYPYRRTGKSFISLKDDFLHFHRVKYLITFYGLRKRHDLVRHEASSCQHTHETDREYRVKKHTQVGFDSVSVHRVLSRKRISQDICPFGLAGSYCRPRFRPMVSGQSQQVSEGISSECKKQHTSPLCTPTLLITPHGLNNSNPILNAGLNPTTSITASAPRPPVSPQTLCSKPSRLV